MIFSTNALNLPQEQFGLADIHVGNVIHQNLEKHGGGLKAQYDPTTKKISILNTTDLPPSVLNKILYSTAAACGEYDSWSWYPVVKDKRGVDGNLVVKFSCLKPGTDASTYRIRGRGYESINPSFNASRMDLTSFLSSRSPIFITPPPHQSPSGGILLDSGNPFLSSPFLHQPQRTSRGMTLNSLHTSYEMSPLNSLPGFNNPLHSASHPFEGRERTIGLIPQNRMRVRPEFTPLSAAQEDIVSIEDVAAMEKSISASMLNIMEQVLNKHEDGKGIWYPGDYVKFLAESSESMPEEFFTGHANEEYFEKTGRFTFILKDGKKASEALRVFLNGPTLADCGNATVACYYKCILDIIGEEKFDKIFSSKPFCLRIGQSGITDVESPISCFSDYTEASKLSIPGVFGKRPLQIGEECHFDGVIWYANKHPQGFGGGWNVIYIGNTDGGEQLFMAHGFEKPLTEREINQQFIELYNRERTPQDDQHILSAKKPRLYDEKTNQYLIDHYTLQETEKTEKFIKGFLVGSVRGLNAKELVKLKNSSDEFFMAKLNLRKAASMLSTTTMDLSKFF